MNKGGRVSVRAKAENLNVHKTNIDSKEMIKAISAQPTDKQKEIMKMTMSYKMNSTHDTTGDGRKEMVNEYFEDVRGLNFFMKLRKDQNLRDKTRREAKRSNQTSHRTYIGYEH